MKKKLRTILAWTLVSLLLQYGAYALIENQVGKVLAPQTLNEPITNSLKATIPGTNLENIQISYEKDYLAYTENGTLKIINLTNSKVVFEKSSPSTTDKTLGVLSYQWLPDRNTLLYFYAKKNPEYVASNTTSSQSKIVYLSTTTQDTTEDTNQSTTTEDPKETPKVTPQVPATTTTEKKVVNPQVTELYALKLPNSDEDTAPDDEFNQTINIPAGGKIENVALATSTNLIFFIVKNQSSQSLYEIDVMQHVNTRNRTGEVINTLSVSEINGTLYYDSKLGSTQQVYSYRAGNRFVVSKNKNDIVLGVKGGKVFIGEVVDNALIKVKTTTDRTEITDNPALKTEWEGSIPFVDMQTLIGSKGQIIVYNNQTANTITEGQLSTISLAGDENHISFDGAELVQFTRSGTTTLLETQPLKAK